MLSGCFIIPPVPQSAAQPVELRAGDLEFGLFETSSGVRFAPDGTRATLDDAMDASAQAFYDGGGAPTNCEASFATTRLLVAGESDDDDDFVSIGAYDYEPLAQGRLSIAARVFDERDDAAAFLAAVAAAVGECPFGYELTSLDPTWHVEHNTTAEAKGLNLPDGVTALYHEELTAEALDVLYRDTLLVYANVVIAVTCEVRAGSPFDYADCDAIAEQVAEQLVEIR